jgi:sulfur-oxidizing protein SoxY
LNRRSTVQLLGLIGAGFCLPAARAQTVAKSNGNDPFEGDPYQSHQWPEIKREFFGNGVVQFDDRVQVAGPKFAEDPMNVPISVSVRDLPDVEQILIVVDRNPIRRVLEYFPVSALPSVAFRFKLEQSSPVRVGARTKDGVWHLGQAWVDSTGGGCTVAGASRKDGSWHETLGQVNGKMFSQAPGMSSLPVGSSRLRVRVMHPMDTGLVGGVPAFYVNKLSVSEPSGKVLLRMNTYEPVSENPVFSFDFPGLDKRKLILVGTDNNGNRIESVIE